jgi:CRISPR-associated protein Cmr6
MLPDFKRPFYKTAHEIPENLPDGGHEGLWYDKFGSQWKWSKEDGRLAFEKLKWIETVTKGGGKDVEKCVGRAELIAEMKERLIRLVVTRRGKVCFFKTGGRFVTGLGREHPVENGFSWHFLLGTPFLPGSSVKGLVRAWAENWLQEDDVVISRIFGLEGKKTRQVGSVVFLDALPVEPVKLEAEVMTPHYMEYYRGKEPPADWHSPNPIPFLTVADGQTFVFALAPRRLENEDDMSDMELAAGWLEEALVEIGAGAKTAAGYGRFIRQPNLEKELLERWAPQQLEEKRNESLPGEPEALPAEPASPILAEMEKDGYSSDPEKFMQALTTKWLAKMQSTETEAACRREIAVLLAAWYQKAKPGQWKKPNKKNTVKIAAIKAALETS